MMILLKVAFVYYGHSTAGRLPNQQLEAQPSIHYEGEPPQPKKAAKGTPKKVQKAMQSQENGAPNVRASREQAAGSLSTVGPATGTVVKMGRREGWARFLAYEVGLLLP